MKATVHVNEVPSRNKVEVVIPLVKGGCEEENEKTLEVLIDYIHQLFSSVKSTSGLGTSIYQSNSEIVIIFSAFDEEVIKKIAEEISDKLTKKGKIVCRKEL